MKYSIDLNNVDKELTSSTEEKVSEVGLVLQIHQDLKKLESMGDFAFTDEDKIIQKILTQILAEELGGEDKITYPEYYDKDNPAK
tara:strand:- start:171 stop:425 length:255 start_codon:yes stop_codon:yes gene_type:complete